MKLKHRKLILIISLSAMGVGLISFSIAGNKEKKASEVASLVDESEAIVKNVTEAPTQEMQETPTPSVTESVTNQVTEDVTQEATQEPTEQPTPEPTKGALELEEDAYPEINELITQYLQAKLDGNAKKLKKLVTDSSYIDAETIQKKTEFIDSYDKVKVYTLPGEGDIDYIAYVYMEVKISTIDTKAPGLDVYYIKKVDDAYKIVCGDISDETDQYIQECTQSEGVQALVTKVDKKLSKAIAKDEDLAEFCKKLSVTPKSEKEDS